MAPEVIRSQGSYTSACDMWSIGVVAHALLCGTLPFDAARRDEKVRLISEAKVDFASSAWAAVSSSAKQFVRGLLQADPSLRMSAKQALSHEWIKSCGGKLSDAAAGRTAAEQFANSTGVLRSLQEFSRMEDFKKVILEVLAFTTPSENLEELRRRFVAMDSDGSGLTTLEQFRS